MSSLTSPRGIRNNNPGNLRPGPAWLGLAAPASDGGPGGGYARFTSPYYGIRALAINLRNYDKKHGLRTVRGVINRWAPPVENNTSAYVTAVAKALGVGPDATINTADPAVLAKLVTAIIKHENGQQPYTDAEILTGVKAALA
ncbi:MAG: hypothetical protein Q8Q73_14800 [Stagnimonas sp.]|nr:hypothetical protein [Stagnimonas sp.]